MWNSSGAFVMATSHAGECFRFCARIILRRTSLRLRALRARAALLASPTHVQQRSGTSAHAHDGAVPPHQGGAPEGRAAALPARRLLRDVLRGRRRRVAAHQPRAHPTQRGPDVRAPAPRGEQLHRSPAQARPQGRHLRPGRGGEARQARVARGHRDPLAGHALRRAPAAGRAEQLPRRRLRARQDLRPRRRGTASINSAPSSTSPPAISA